MGVWEGTPSSCQTHSATESFPRPPVDMSSPSLRIPPSDPKPKASQDMGANQNRQSRVHLSLSCGFWWWAWRFFGKSRIGMCWQRAIASKFMAALPPTNWWILGDLVLHGSKLYPLVSYADLTWLEYVSEKGDLKLCQFFVSPRHTKTPTHFKFLEGWYVTIVVKQWIETWSLWVIIFPVNIDKYW